MDVSSVPQGSGMASTLSRYTKASAENAMASVSGKVAPVFDTGKSGIVQPDPVDLGRQTFEMMESGTIVYNSVAKLRLTGPFHIDKQV